MQQDLIDLVRERPSIYDKSDPQYKERQKQFQAIADILNRRYNTNFTATNVHGFWDGMERDFKKSYKSLKSLKSGSGAADAITITCPNFKELQFLIPSTRYRPPISSMKFAKKDQQNKRDVTSQNIWQKVPQVFTQPETRKRKRNESRGHKSAATATMPNFDKFARFKIAETSELRGSIDNATELLETSCEKIVASITNAGNTSSGEYDVNFKFVYEKLLVIPEAEIDIVLAKILVGLEEVRKQSL